MGIRRRHSRRDGLGNLDSPGGRGVTRPQFATRPIVLLDESRRALAIAMVQNMPLGTEVVGREQVKARKLDQNALMWVGPLRDIASQAWINGRQFSDTVWHEHFKRLYLPEEDDPDLAKKVKNPDIYRKWGETPGGERVCVGSTTELTVYGFSEYLEQIYADGAGMGVMFSARMAA